MAKEGLVMPTVRSKMSHAWGLPFRQYRVWLDGQLFIERRRLQTPLFGVLFSKILLDDRTRDPHTHRRAFITMAVTGSYTELVWKDAHSAPIIREHKRLRPYLMRRGWAHQIVTVHGTLRTLLLAGIYHQNFQFWTPEGPIDWESYHG